MGFNAENEFSLSELFAMGKHFFFLDSASGKIVRTVRVIVLIKTARVCSRTKMFFFSQELEQRG